jgi:(2R)-ethylmalonyl-CoA mutase
VHGEYRGPTGVSAGRVEQDRRAGRSAPRGRCRVSDKLGRRLKFLVGKPGLDGHSNGAEQIAFRARDCGMDITYEGIRLTPEEIVAAALIGLSILSGSHIPLVKDVLNRLKSAGATHIPVIVGGIIPDEDARNLLAMGVSKVYTPKDFELNSIMKDVVQLADPEDVAAA